MSEIIKTLEFIRTSISKNIDIAKPYSNSVVLDNFRDDLKDIDRLITNLNLANEQIMNNNDTHDTDCMKFADWLQDNYSTNKVRGGFDPLPKGIWRKDFTDDHYSISEIIARYNQIFETE